MTIKCDVNPSTFVSALQWNPCIPDTVGIIYFDGTLLVSQVSTMQVKKIQSNARYIALSCTVTIYESYIAWLIPLTPYRIKVLITLQMDTCFSTMSNNNYEVYDNNLWLYAVK